MKSLKNGKMLFLSLVFCTSAHAYDRCEYISQGLAGRHSVALLKKDGTKTKVGTVKFTRTRDAYVFSATNLGIIGDVLLPGSPKKVKLKSTAEDCLFVGIGKIESNTLGTIVEGEDMKVFAVQVEDETFESVSFTKF